MSARKRGVLFACIGNSGRSIMAEAFAKHHGADVLEARSGGSRPLGHVLPLVVEAMRERGIDVSGYPSRSFDEAWIRENADLVVTMGCGDDACPAFIGKRMVDWELPDPKHMDLQGIRGVRDEIERRVLLLIEGPDVR